MKPDLGKYSFGTGDRFGRQGEYLLEAFHLSLDSGIPVTPVFNKSYREHHYINSDPPSVRLAVNEAIKKMDWKGSCFIDADHISFTTVDLFLDSSDFFTIDVASFINQPIEEDVIRPFLELSDHYLRPLNIPGIRDPFEISPEFARATARKFVPAIREAGRIYRKIKDKKGSGNFITEISMDEVEHPQSPAELFLILGWLAMEEISFQTLAPRFTGKFFKGIDYQGDLTSFSREFESDLYVIDWAIREFGCSDHLKLSIHSGSDKFSLYPVINRILKKTGKGVHLKTAGTTWLEEMAGVAASNPEGLHFFRWLYREAFNRIEELIAPYLYVTDIDKNKLPDPSILENYDGLTINRMILHVKSDPFFNPDMRQLIHLSYKIAAENLQVFNDLITSNRGSIGGRVRDNIFHRHIKPLFIG